MADEVNANGGAVAPAVLQPQLSTDVVGFNVQNNQPNALGQRYITFQETFLPGEVTTSTDLVAIVGGQKIPVQMDVKTTNADGQYRSALLTFQQPSITANSSLSFMLSTTGTAFKTARFRSPISMTATTILKLPSRCKAAVPLYLMRNAASAGLEGGHGFLLASRAIGSAGTR